MQIEKTNKTNNSSEIPIAKTNYLHFCIHSKLSWNLSFAFSAPIIFKIHHYHQSKSSATKTFYFFFCERVQKFCLSHIPPLQKEWTKTRKWKRVLKKKMWARQNLQNLNQRGFRKIGDLWGKPTTFRLGAQAIHMKHNTINNVHYFVISIAT